MTDTITRREGRGGRPMTRAARIALAAAITAACWLAAQLALWAALTDWAAHDTDTDQEALG